MFQFHDSFSGLVKHFVNSSSTNASAPSVRNGATSAKSKYLDSLLCSLSCLISFSSIFFDISSASVEFVGEKMGQAVSFTSLFNLVEEV